MPRTTKRFLLTVLLYFACAFSVSQAGEARWDSVGVRAGADLTDSNGSRKGNFWTYEAFVNYLLPWSWRSSSGLELRTRLDASAGVLTREKQSGFTASFGPGLALVMFSDRVELDAGLAGSYLSRHDYPGRNLGGTYLFNIHTGLSAYLYRGIGVGYHYEHLSNAYLDSCNPGLNLHMIELKYRFP
jgi:hypothetical protein